MKKIFLFTIYSYLFCLANLHAQMMVEKSKVYQDAVNWYSFDTDGTDSISDNNLKLHHVTVVSDAQRGKIAVINHVDTGYMEFTKPAISSEQFSITTWFYFESTYDDWWQTIFEFANDVNLNNFYFCPNFGSLGTVTEDKVNSKWESVGTNTFQTPLDKWVHLALTFDNGKVSIYADGVLAGTGTFTNTIAGLALNRFFIGANPFRLYRALDAKYDDFAVFNKVLNDQQVYAIAHDTLPTAPKVNPYVFETEDYIFDNWEKGTDGDVTYGYYSLTSGTFADENSALLYGTIKGGGQIALWARVKTDVTVKKPFWIKIDKEPWRESDSITPALNWTWVLLQRISSINSPGHLLRLAPAASNVKVDKFLATYNWDYDPNIDYSKTDNLLPSTPENFTIKGTNAYTSQLKWNSVPATDSIIGYDILDGDRVVAVITDTFVSPLFQASTEYNFSVRSKDQAGNLSARTGMVNITTKDIIFTADFNVKKQTIHHFGASDAWSVETIGLWPDAKRDSLVKVLFSSKFDSNGNPEGAALSNWRFRIGDGSRDQTPQGLSPGNWHKTTHCFLNADGSYNWDKQPGSVWFLKKAKEYGVPHYTGWTDSPPYFYTKSGYVFRITGVTSGYNLKSDKYDAYSEFLANVANHFESEGIHFDVISPVNEPQWSWDYKVGEGGQPGSSCSNMEMATLVKSIDKVFTANSVKSKILISEAGDINYLSGRNGEPAGDQITNFWNSSSTNYIGNLPSLSNYVSGHGYWTENTVVNTVTSRQNLLSKLQSTDPKLEYWQTEYSLLSDGYAKEKANMTPIDYSLFIARVMHYELTVANCTGWDWWSTFSRPWGEDHKYRFALINWYPNVDNVSCNDGTFELNKNLWTIGNFSHFVRPGYQRVGTTRNDFLTPEQSSDKQLISAYLSPNTDTAVFVVINYAEFDQQITLNYTNLSQGDSIEVFKPYVTSAFDNLKSYPEVDAKSMVTVKARSITTFVGAIKKKSVGINRANNRNNSACINVYPNPASKIINVEVKEGIGQKVDIFNVTGEKVATYDLTSNKTSIDISKFRPGCYYISVKNNNIVENKKLIISR